MFTTTLFIVLFMGGWYVKRNRRKKNFFGLAAERTKNDYKNQYLEEENIQHFISLSMKKKLIIIICISQNSS